MPRRIDTALLRALRTHGHQSRAEQTVLVFTRLGEHGGLWLALAGAGAVLDRRRRALFLKAAASIAGAYGLNQAIKVVVRRQRPQLDDLPPLASTNTQISYPSAHAATSFAGARSLARALPAAPLYATALAMAASRPYVGVHYPSDVLAGAALGLAVAELAA